MAEAHQAVAFQFAVTDEGISIHFDRTAVKSALRSFVNMYRKRYLKMRTALLKGVFPASPLSLVVALFVVFGLYFGGVDPTYGLMRWITGFAGWFGYSSSFLRVFVLLMEGLSLWVLFSYLQRYMLKALLMYKGWMYDPRGQRSLSTKIWAILVQLVTGPFRPTLYSYQNSLPRQPVPPLEDTCARYLKSVQPLMEDKEFDEMKILVDQFKNGPGKKMQRYLYLKSWWATNYVTDWWEQYVYLYGRSSIMINSNYYACDNMKAVSKLLPASRAGMLTHSAMRMKRDIENERLKPLIIMGLIPLCSAQYERVFGTCRIPGQEADKILHCSGAESRFIVVNNMGHWFKVPLYHKNKLLEPIEIEWQMEQILNDTSEVGPGEEHLAALTAHDRKSWAIAREQYFSKGINRDNMEAIEKAAFVIFFDEKSPDLESKDSEDGDINGLTSYCKDLLHGNGYSRWFDKSFTAVIYANGKMGLTTEHAWADAPICGHMLEYCCNEERNILYRPDGHCRGEMRFTPPQPQRLHWDLPPMAISRIEAALKSAQEQIADLDLYVLEHDTFGKGDVKKCKISPDAFVQMALQLAYYRDAGNKFCLTYEASMTRLYLEGRTETVRPVTIESAAFVKAMCNPSATKEERKRLLYTAVEKHALSYKLAMTGKGIDRHLFCLYVMSKYLKIESPFLAKVLGEPWRLSTSQTPTQQTGKLDYNSYPDRIAAGGGFGPVTKDGYGVSYVFPGDYVIYFHVSSFNSSPSTDSRRFARRIQESMKEMREMFADTF